MIGSTRNRIFTRQTRFVFESAFLEVLEALLLVEVDPVLGQSVNEEYVDLLLAEDARHLGEEPLERPHLLRVDLEQPGISVRVRSNAMKSSPYRFR